VRTRGHLVRHRTEISPIAVILTLSPQVTSAVQRLGRQNECEASSELGCKSFWNSVQRRDGLHQGLRTESMTRIRTVAEGEEQDERGKSIWQKA